MSEFCEHIEQSLGIFNNLTYDDAQELHKKPCLLCDAEMEKKKVMSPKGRTLTTTRVVTQEECPWLDMDLPLGTVVYEFYDCTYGCVSPTGVAVKLKDDPHEPFYEIPVNSVVEVFLE